MVQCAGRSGGASVQRGISGDTLSLLPFPQAGDRPESAVFHQYAHSGDIQTAGVPGLPAFFQSVQEMDRGLAHGLSGQIGAGVARRCMVLTENNFSRQPHQPALPFLVSYKLPYKNGLVRFSNEPGFNEDSK